jgi:hypothetical protein
MTEIHPWSFAHELIGRPEIAFEASLYIAQARR